MCDMVKAVKGGLSVQEAEKLIDEKIEEMCSCEDEEEINDELYMDCVENFDAQPSLESIQTTISTLQHLASQMNIVSTLYIESEDEQGISKVDCGAPKSCTGLAYMQEYLPTMGLSLDQMPRVMTNDVFMFGASKFPTKGKIVVPIKFKDTQGRIHYSRAPQFMLRSSLRRPCVSNTYSCLTEMGGRRNLSGDALIL